MSEFAVKGPEIRPMIKIARKGPIPFAFNPGKSDNEHLLAMDRRKPASVLGKSAKKDGPSPKVAFGMCEVDGKVLTLRCERALPALAKRLKKYLKSQKVSLNVVVLDADGQLLEEDIEDLPDDPQDALDAAEDNDTDAQNDVDQLDPRDLIQRLQAISARVKEAPAGAVDKLNAAMGSAAAQIKAQALEDAQTQIEALEQALDKLGDQQSNIPPAPPNPLIAQLTSAIEATEQSLEAVEGEARAKLQQALTMIGGLVSQEDFTKAANGLKAVRAQIAQLTAPATDEPDTTAQEAAPAEAAPAANERPKVSVVAFQRSRIMWIDSKRALQAGLETLRDAIVAQADGDEDKAEIEAAAQEMASRISDFDDQLEDVLDDITNTPDGPDRDSLRNKAITVIKQYTNILDTSFFQRIGSNPFTKLNAVASAKQSLNLIQKTLA